MRIGWGAVGCAWALGAGAQSCVDGTMQRSPAVQDATSGTPTEPGVTSPGFGTTVPLGVPMMAPPVAADPPINDDELRLLVEARNTLLESPLSDGAAPLSGGTLTTLDTWAIAADPDRDAVFIVDLGQGLLTHRVDLPAGSEPGRLVADDQGVVHVVTRRGGTLVSIDVATGTVVAMRDVCAAPRGVAYDAGTQLLHVACQAGELVSLGVDPAEAPRVLQLARDLRDVVVDGDRLLVSRFKSAEVLVVEDDAVSEILRLPAEVLTVTPGAGGGELPDAGPEVPELPSSQALFSAAVAWRLKARPDGGAFMTLQRDRESPIDLSFPASYGGGCQGDVIRGQLAEIDGAGMRALRELPGTLHTDIAVNSVGSFAVIAASASWQSSSHETALVLGRIGDLGSSDLFTCGVETLPVIGELTSVVFDASGQLVVQSRAPAHLIVIDPLTRGQRRVVLDPDRGRDTGYALFHAAGSGGIACAACHPEGQDDGRVWNFEGVGPRRTQALGGGVLGTLPLHWQGEFVTLSGLVDTIMLQRMAFSFSVSPGQVNALGVWLDTLPVVAYPSTDLEAVGRGRAVFELAACDGCHAGTRLTDNLSHDVGSGGVYQTPPLLGLGARPPHLHDGCAATVRDTLQSACANSHGDVSALTESDLGDLIEYLEAL